MAEWKLHRRSHDAWISCPEVALISGWAVRLSHITSFGFGGGWSS
jgi:hypothetical protein